MELSWLLGTSFSCACGRVHEVPVKRLVYEVGAIGRVSEIVRENGGGRVAVVADVRTWKVCGAAVHDALRGAGLDVSRVIVPDSARGGPICDDVTVQWLLGQLRHMHPAVVVAVGSGVVNDLSKWSSFEMGIPYIVVATAASMNGYSAANVAPTIAGVKTLIEARPPVAVVAEPSVIERAPHEMTAAGFGDTIAKFQSNADWITNRLLLGEYYCELCAGIASSLEPLYLDHPEDIRDGRSEAVKGLFEALFWTGLAMTLVGTSAPASGGEHLLSHTLDMMAAVRGGAHDLHGRQVGIGTLLSAALYERVLATDSPSLRALPAAVDETFWAVPSVAAAVAKQYAAKAPSYERVRLQIASGSLWDELRTRLAGTVKSPVVVRDWLRRAGGAVSIRDIGCSREWVRDAVLHVHEIRKRFTIVDLAWLVGVLPDAADDLIDQWLLGSRRVICSAALTRRHTAPGPA
ncbi:MAG: iron-containing alcohol dehydrogenase [Sedimentisphaerales bacterium]|nr:iron-containing alcohol dehydrogenase [Sedimentisphaerales bacterium]